jgi:predicted transcriptional regulator
MAKKDITINDLAVMVQNGFTETHKEMRDGFNAANKRFEQVDKRLDSMVTKAEMNRRFDGLEDRVLASHQKRIEKLEAEVKELRKMFAT